MKLKQIFRYTHPDEDLKTVDGVMKWGDYIKEKAEQFEKSGRRVEIRPSNRKNQEGFVTLFANSLCVEPGCPKTAYNLNYCKEHASAKKPTC